MGVLGAKCCPKKEDGVIGHKSLGWSLGVVSGRSLTSLTASEKKVWSSVSEGFPRASNKTLLKELLNSFTIDYQLLPLEGE